MLLTWAVPYAIAVTILSFLILVADASEWGRGAMYAILTAVIASTYLLHLWLEERVIKRRTGHSAHFRRRG
jgi:hypothetical protein